MEKEHEPMSIYRQRMQFVTALDRYSEALTAWDRQMVNQNISEKHLSLLTKRYTESRSALIALFCGAVGSMPENVVEFPLETAQGSTEDTSTLSDTDRVPATAIRVSGGPQNDEGGYSEEDSAPIVGSSPFIVTRVRR